MPGEHISVLLCTYNGGDYLAQQLASIHRQTYPDWSLHISDDGSTDATISILSAFCSDEGAGRTTLTGGPRLGSTENFIQLLVKAPPAPFYAFCDQDDIWHLEKLARAHAWLAAQPASWPALYCARAVLVDDKGQAFGYTPLCVKPPTFANALTQNIASGNTFVFNHAARRLLESLWRAGHVGVVHDWTLYLAVTAASGKVHYGPLPVLDYRQHAGNQIGAALSWGCRARRWMALLQGGQQAWYEQHDELLAVLFNQGLLSPENVACWRTFQESRKARFPWLRLQQLLRSGVYRQTALQNIGLAAATLLRRL